MNDIHECPICQTYAITVQTRTQYFNQKTGKRMIKTRSCLPCWRDFLDLDEAMQAMNGPGA